MGEQRLWTRITVGYIFSPLNSNYTFQEIVNILWLFFPLSKTALKNDQTKQGCSVKTPDQGCSYHWEQWHHVLGTFGSFSNLREFIHGGILPEWSHPSRGGAKWTTPLVTKLAWRASYFSNSFIYSQFYLYRPISQVTICLKRLCNLYSIRHLLSLDPQIRQGGKKEEIIGRATEEGFPLPGQTDMQ